jgi:S-DNA-T family DNA segregation ATPase FtsK/SpoIIIE
MGELGLIVEAAGRSTPLLVDADPDLPVRELLAELSDHAGVAADPPHPWVLCRTGQTLDPEASVGQVGLQFGDRLVADEEAVPRDKKQRIGAGTTQADWRVVIDGGPLGGRSFTVGRGGLVVGRDQTVDLTLADPAVSSRHARLAPTDEGLVLDDLGSTNGTLVDGHRVAGATLVRPGSLVEIGSSLLSVEPMLAPPTGHPSESDGHLLFNRPPRVRRPKEDTGLELPSPPRPPSGAHLPLITALVPLVAGGALVAFTGQLVYLLFVALSPIMMVGSAVSQRRSGRHDYRRARARFERDLTRSADEADRRHAALVAWRRAMAPSPARLVERALGSTPDLWERRPDDVDFLSLRVGMGDQPSLLHLGDGGPDVRPEATDDPDGLQTRLIELRQRHRLDLDTPVVAGLAEGPLGVAGDPLETDRLTRALVLQAVTLHSPRDLALVVLSPRDGEAAWGWTRWLPHTTSLESARSVGASDDDVRGLLGALDELVAARREDSGRGFGMSRPRWSPHVLLVITGDIPVPRPVLARVLADGPAHGVTAVVVAPSARDIPGECRHVAHFREDGALRLVESTTGNQLDAVVPDGVGLDVVTETGLALAPLRDVSSSADSGDLATQVLLLDVLGMQEPTPDSVRTRWQHPPRGLGAPIGLDPAGPTSLDLRRDGPHALIAGTTGSGKSELLQTLVVSLAASHPPDRLTFVLIDYKGGAAFKDCVHLPHVVGFFTDLDGHLARRALISLEAELRRREAALREAGAKDLAEMESRAPGTAPASLILVIDEFAFLKREVPEFVDGVVDIAQRGRSLGVHLVLATQRPSGVVDDKVRANTNLRIALRVADDQDSDDVIGRRDAARISKALPGRAYVRRGHSEVDHIQTAYAGAHRVLGDRRPEASVRPFPFGPVDPIPTRAGPVDPDAPTDLQRLVSAIRGAFEQAGISEPPRPWLEPLATLYPLVEVMAGGPRSHQRPIVTLGMLDEPHLQRQHPYVVDLDQIGHLLVYGTSGAGKTTLLRSVASSLALQLSPADLHLYGLDLASRGLLALESLPHSGGIVAGDDAERVERLIRMLEDLVADRQARLGRVGASSLVEYRAHEALPWVVVLVDGYAVFRSTYELVDRGELIDRFHRLVGDGRSVGLHFVISAEQRGAVATSLLGLIPERLVMRMANPDDYMFLGMSEVAKDASLPPGRGFRNDGTELQVCSVSDDPSGAAQTATLAELGARLAAVAEGEGLAPVPAVRAVPDDITSDALLRWGLPAGAAAPPARGGAAAPTTATLALPLGLDGATFTVAKVTLGDIPTFLVAGPDGAGRTTALRTLARGIFDAWPEVEAYLLAPRRNSLDEGGLPWRERAHGLAACESMAERLSALVLARREEATAPAVAIIDDADDLTDGMAAINLESVVKAARDDAVVVVAACHTLSAHRAYGGWLAELRRARHGLLLSPDVDIDGDLFTVKLPRRSTHRFPPGRGYLVRRTDVGLVQVAR